MFSENWGRYEMLPLILIVFTLSLAISLKYLLKSKIETILTIVVLSFGLLLYVFGLFKQLNIAYYLINILSIIAFIFDIYLLTKKKVKISEIFTLGTIIYILLTVILFFYLRNCQFTDWDEYSHWGINLKMMLKNNLLWGDSSFDIIHGAYPPLAGIIEYYICRLNGEYTEGVAYFSLAYFTMTIMISIFKNYNYRDTFKSIIVLATVYLAIFMLNFTFATLYLDLLLGIIFFVSIYHIYTLDVNEDKAQYILVCLLLVGILMVKDAGIIFVAICLLLLFVNLIVLPIFKVRKIDKALRTNLLFFGIIILIVLIAYLSWKLYLKVNVTEADMVISEINIIKYIKSLFLRETSHPKYYDITFSYYNILNQGIITTENFIFNTAIKFVVFVNVIALLYIVLIQKGKEKNKFARYLIILDCGFLLYLAFLLFLFLFIFIEYEGRGLASYSRYIGTYLIAFFLAIVAAIAHGKEKGITYPLLLIILAFTVTSVNLNTVLFPNNSKVSTIPPEIASLSNEVTNLLDKDDNVYIIYQDSNGIHLHFIRYLIAPIKSSYSNWSLGDPYYEGDIWTHNLSEQEIIEFLKEKEYTHILFANIDSQIIDKYSKLVDGYNYEELNGNLFEINIENNEVKIYPVNNLDR